MIGSLCTKSGNVDVVAEDLARNLLKRLNISSHPPVDLNKVAKLMGVTRIIPRKQVEEGRLERNRAGTLIYVRAGSSFARRRFTIAHEIGHLLLSGDNEALQAYRSRTRTTEERFCDDFAAALLIPSDWVSSQFNHLPRNLDTVRRLATHASVSLAAAAVRLNEIAGWREALLQWRREEGAWRLRWACAISPSIRGHLRSSATTTIVLDRLGESARDLRVRLPMTVKGVDKQVSAEVSIRGSSALALISQQSLSGTL